MTAPAFPLSVQDIQIVTHSTPISESKVGETVFVYTPVENMLSKPMNVTYITLMKDENGFTVALEWSQVSLEGQWKGILSNAWVPEESGDYDIDTFVWTDITNSPIPLAESVNTKLKIIP